MVYRGDAVIGNADPVKAECTTSDRGRTIQRSLAEADRDQVRGHHSIAAGQNLTRFLAASGWGRRHTPWGRLVLLLGPPPWLLAVSG